MILKVIDAKYKGGYTIECTFDDGVVKDVDFTPIPDAPAFRDLKDLHQFRQFGLDETLMWANGADIAPEWLYDHGVVCR